MDISYSDFISVEVYNELRASAGWLPILPEQAQAGLDGSACVVVAYCGARAVAMARVLWDGGYAALLKDVLVLPDFQGQGIGAALVERIVEFLRKQLRPGWSITVDVMSAVGKERFYEKMGFVERPHSKRGAGMDRVLYG